MCAKSIWVFCWKNYGYEPKLIKMLSPDDGKKNKGYINQEVYQIRMAVGVFCKLLIAYF